MKTTQYIFLFLIFICSSIYAQTISLYFENDVLFHDDTDYTHGTQIKYMANKNFWKFDDIGIMLAQTMYTPNDLRNPFLIKNDRPYAGLLGITVIGQKYFLNYKDEIELTAGIIGKYSFAGKTQTFIHKITDSTKPMGWDYQLPNEPIINIQLNRTYSFKNELTDFLNIYYEPITQIQIGTWQNDALIGIDLSLGQKTFTDYGITQRKIHKAEYFILGGFSGKTVWYSTQLDGNVFKTPTHTVDSKPFVGELHYGIGGKYKNVKLQILNMHRSKEYKTQSHKVRFSSILLAYEF